MDHNGNGYIDFNEFKNFIFHDPYEIWCYIWYDYEMMFDIIFNWYYLISINVLILFNIYKFNKNYKIFIYLYLISKYITDILFN